MCEWVVWVDHLMVCGTDMGKLMMWVDHFLMHENDMGDQVVWVVFDTFSTTSSYIEPVVVTLSGLATCLMVSV